LRPIDCCARRQLPPSAPPLLTPMSPIFFLTLTGHTQRVSAEGSTGRGQRTFPSAYYEDGNTSPTRVGTVRVERRVRRVPAAAGRRPGCTARRTSCAAVRRDGAAAKEAVASTSRSASGTDGEPWPARTADATTTTRPPPPPSVGSSRRAPPSWPAVVERSPAEQARPARYTHNHSSLTGPIYKISQDKLRKIERKT